MQIKITYEPSHVGAEPCAAWTKIGDRYIYGIGATFDAAKARLLDKLRRVSVVPPEPETVDVDIQVQP